MEPEDEALNLDKSNKTFLHQVTETLLYYAREVDSTMLLALSSITPDQ